MVYRHHSKVVRVLKQLPFTYWEHFRTFVKARRIERVKWREKNATVVGVTVRSCGPFVTNLLTILRYAKRGFQ